MTTIRHTIRAKCPPDRVWSVLSDLEAVQHYNPTVRSATVQGDQRRGIGATRACDLHPTGRVVERVTRWEEGRALGLEVVESGWPIHFMRWVTRVEADEGGTRIEQDLEYRVKFGPLGVLLDRLVMKRKLSAALDEVFVALARFAERDA